MYHAELTFSVKKVTKQLLGYESQLLNGYKEYLTRLEKLTDCLRKKKGDTRPVSKVYVYAMYTS